MRLFELEQKLKNATNLLELKRLLHLYLRGKQISTYSFTYYRCAPNSVNPLKYDFCSDNFLNWHQHYHEEQYSEIDSTLQDSYQQTLPIHWDLQEQLANAKSERERQMRLDSIAFGAEKGISIPIHGPLEDFAMFLVVQMQGEDCLDSQPYITYDLLTAAYFFYHYLHKLLIHAPAGAEQYLLTERELQCLQLMAKNLSVKEAAKQLAITERTINFHIQKLNKKLGVKNKYQALAKAKEKFLI